MPTCSPTASRSRSTWRWDAGDRLVHALPIFHGHGLCVGLYTSLLAGSSVVLLPRFDVDAVFDACARHDATLFFGVPTMYHRLAASSRVGELRRLRLAVSGSAPLSADLHRSIAASARTEVLERYGMTETLMTLSNPYEGERRPGTVGFPFPGVEARVDDDGAVLVRGPTVFSRLLGAPGGDGRALRRRVVPDRRPRRGRGRLRPPARSVDRPHHLGRLQRLSRRGRGRPARALRRWQRSPSPARPPRSGVRSCAPGSSPTVRRGPMPTRCSPTPRERLAPYKRPRRVRFVDSLPRNSMGKVRRSELR